MKDTNIEQTILKTVRAGSQAIEGLIQDLRNQEQSKQIDYSHRIDVNPQHIFDEVDIDQ